MLSSGTFRHLWDAARLSGESLRGRALEILYTERPQPGGVHPDPRKPAAFSSGAVLSTACRILGLRVKQAPQHVADEANALVGPAQRPLRAWLLTYPKGAPTDR